MAIYKVRQGESLTMQVTAVVRDVAASNPRYGPSHKFVGHAPGDDDACVFMTPASADRQLARLGFTLDTVVGQTIEFARSGEYVDINLPAGVSAPSATRTSPAPASQPTTAPAVPSAASAPVTAPAPAASTDDRLTKLFALYDRCFDHAALTSKRLMKADIAVTHEGVSAMTSTLFIEATHKGLGT